MHQPVAGKFFLKSWLLLLVTILASIYACISWLDAPIAFYFLKYASPLSGLGRAFGSTILVARQTPLEFLRQPDSHVFHFFQGSQYSSFPSGHMVMASAFAFAIIRLYPRTWPPLTALLFLGVILLVIGDFHFLSDVVAGAFVGGTAGFLAGELWCQHT